MKPESPRESPPTAEEVVGGDVSRLVEHLFRQEYARIVAILTRVFGPEHLGLVEDVVQESLVRALQTWPYHGIPDNPSAWILRAARNRALDVVRRERVFRDKEHEIVRLMDPPGPPGDGDLVGESGLGDDRLAMMFVCCHPGIPAEAQTALALKTLGGFGVTEIARAFLVSEAAIAKRLTRAKQRIREARIPFEIPGGHELKPRIDAVLRTLYLLFNEGYKASTGDRLVRREVCQEAVRLTALLAEHPAGDQPKTHALLALMLLNGARLSAREDVDGNLLRLRDQDRSLWDGAMMARGLFHLSRSAAGEEVSEFHLQSAIAACHCLARDHASTDWGRILSLYDHLLALDPSPVVALNRAVAVGRVHGPQAGLEAVEAIRDRDKLESYHLLYAVLGEFEAESGDPLAAAGYFRRALRLAEIESERRFLEKRFRACEAEVLAEPG